MAPGTVLVWSCLEFLPGYSLPCIGEWHSEKLPLSRRFLVVVEICFMGSVARGNEVGLFGSPGRKRWVLSGCGVTAVPFLRYLVLLFSYCLKQFVYMLIKRNESHSERV